MCGIVAAYGAADPETLERMLERVAHRGPDDRGAVEIEEGWLGYRRLSIVDVGGGKQPLVTSDGEMWLVGDGEVRFASEMHAFDEEWRPHVEPFPPGCVWTPEDGLRQFASVIPETLEA